MKKFSDFNIKIKTKIFEGDKIKASRVLNREIIVHDYKIEESKIFKEKGNDKCLHLQISINDIKYIIFTSSSWLIEALSQIDKESFPFKTIIIKDQERYLFT